MPFRSDVDSDVVQHIGDWQKTTASVCPGWGSDYDVASYSREGLELRDVHEEVKKPEALVADGSVYNSGGAPATHVMVKAAIYNAMGQYTGQVWTSVDTAIPPGKSAHFRVDQGVRSFGGEDAVHYAGPEFTYRLSAGRDSGVWLIPNPHESFGLHHRPMAPPNPIVIPSRSEEALLRLEYHRQLFRQTTQRYFSLQLK